MIDFYSDEIPDFFKKPENYHKRSPLLLTYPLNYAAARGDIKSVYELIERGVDVNSRGDMQETPLHEATTAESIEIVSALLNAGASKNIKNEFGKTPLDLAIQTNNKKIIELIRSYNSNPPTISIAEIAGIYAQEYNFPQENFNINTSNEFGEFPIHIATRRSSIIELRSLLVNNCNVNVQTEDEMKYTALHYAAGIGNLTIIKFLLKNEAAHSLLDGFNRTAIDLMYLIGDAENIFYMDEWLKVSKLSND
ncbi:ankyrin repeat domain-containing protein [Diaphorobacter aerolatus]|uniref:Ankyrin repeat domain-containing protein n=1 Tax=Diaphorobacter aerolatus TaxID=1288495 RepID=A0A7H0GHS1_9BURK|nr:ankyrin repeat domain-containing protein [Diaphorobacter aerolatus]QNP47837.1 ankyrin repeat domain-containing protein [Diaphorobacter aerolatus]